MLRSTWTVMGIFGSVLAFSNAEGSSPVVDVTSLNGIYFALRHGESLPSFEQRVCSSIACGTDPANGLTAKGREEVIQNTTAWATRNRSLILRFLKKGNLKVATSPFSRTKETAALLVEAMAKVLEVKIPQSIVIVENDLRERGFGEFEGQGNSMAIYERVWAQDKVDPSHSKWGVESAANVQSRETELLARFEKESKKSGGKLFILVGHGDPLKILQTVFQKVSPAFHTDPIHVDPLKTAEFRELFFK